MSQPTDPQMNVVDLMRQRAEEIARRWRERNPQIQEPVQQQQRPASSLAAMNAAMEEQARLEERLEAVRQLEERQQQLTGSLQKELAAQEELKKLDIRLDPEVNRIAELFYSGIMRRVYFEFGHSNPDWQSLGAREKRLWLEATEIVLDELAKTPVQHKELAAIVNKRIIQG